MSDIVLTTLRKGLASVFPPVTTKLLKELVNPDPDLKRIGELIGMDPGLTSTILSLANSPIYGQAHKIADIQRATVVLGNKEILKIALSLSFQKNTKAFMARKGTDPYNNWRMIIWSAIAAEHLALDLAPEKAGMAYICALLKDLSILLLCASSETCVSLFDNGDDIITLRSGQFEQEKSMLGHTHPVLTQILLDEWNLPDFCYDSILKHHELNRIQELDPFSQSVALATRWAEVEFSALERPEPLFQFQSLLASVTGLDRTEVAKAREVCTERFKAMCTTLDLDPAGLSSRLYDYSIQAMQTFYFQCMEIQSMQGGLPAIASAMANHFRWNWGLENWELLLFEPNAAVWKLFRQTGPTGNPNIEVFPQVDRVAWGLSEPGHSAESGGLKLAEFRHESPTASTALEREINLYFRFFGHAFSFYYLQHAAMESKARTLDILPVGVARLDGDGRILQANERFRSFFSRSVDGAAFWPAISSAAKIPPDPHWDTFLTGSKAATFNRLFCPLGAGVAPKTTCMYINAHKVILDGRLEIIALAEDITQLAELENEAVQQREFLNSLLEAMQDIVLTVDKEGTILFISHEQSRELLGRNIFEIARPESVLTVDWGPASLKSGHPLEVKMHLGRNNFKSLEFIVTPLHGGQSSYLIVGRDLTQIRRLEEKIKLQAAYDNLTKLFNRHQFQLAIEREISRNGRTQRPMGIIFFDVDHFKTYNDTHGHQEGDKVLQNIGTILRQNLRKGMDFPCRYGGDEFVILVSEVNPSVLQSMAERIARQFETMFDSAMTLSIGLAMLLAGESAEELLYRADHASYASKARGGNTITWAEEPAAAS
ncbi:MAG: diguanylate cyclase [Deltaproteobacteria bacterium]|nr:diguanylate cyclase [Deltaproteobacteria bacterium]